MTGRIANADVVELSIIIVNWNSLGFLLKCLTSIHTLTTGPSFEVIVIDNCSSDRCRDVLDREFPSVVFIQSEKNLGFAGANNVAVTHARGKMLLFLNPDTEVRGAALKTLYDISLARKDAGAIGARLLNTDGSLQISSLQAFPTLLNELCDSQRLRNWFPRSKLWGTRLLYDSSNLPSRVEGISGACLMTPHEIFTQVGGISGNYFMYYEDVDYCFKCVQSGRTNYYVPTAEIVHHGGKSSGGHYSKFSCVMMVESAWRYFRLRRNPAYALLFRAFLGFKALFFSGILVLFCPLLFLLGRRGRAVATLRKWLVILNWAVGREQKWVAQFRGASD